MPETKKTGPCKSVELPPLKQKQRVLNIMIVYTICFGVVDAFLPNYDPKVSFIFRLPLIGLALCWCKIDAEQQGFVIGKFTRLALIFITVVALPLYLINTRGIRGVQTAFLATAFSLMLFVLEDAATLVTLEVGQILGIWQYSL